MAECPHCSKPIVNRLPGREVTINVDIRQPIAGIMYACPNCQKVLGCQNDPAALRKAIVSDLLDKLSPKPGSQFS